MLSCTAIGMRVDAECNASTVSILCPGFVSVPGALACLRLLLQSLCDFFPPSGTQLDLSDWAFLSAGKGVLRYSVPKYFSLINVGSGFHCLRSVSFSVQGTC
jgi:hypothetical protein